MVNPRLGERLTASAEAGGRHVRLTVEYTKLDGWLRSWRLMAIPKWRMNPHTVSNRPSKLPKKSQKRIWRIGISGCLRSNGELLTERHSISVRPMCGRGGPDNGLE